MNATETTEFHTRILRVTLSVEESAIFWLRSGPDEPSSSLNPRAFDERWYGGRSVERVKKLHEDFMDRYSFPGARAALRLWMEKGMPAEAQRLCAHWHMQLTDPLYRAFTGDWLVQRRATGHKTVDRDIVSRWLAESWATDYAPATRQMFAGKLLTSAAQAGLLGPGVVRAMPLPACGLEPLAYLLHLLRAVHVEGSLLDNVYLRSVEMAGSRLDARLKEGAEAGWWRYSRMGDLVEMSWTWADLGTWRKETT